jgi:DNA replication and repair protein RecF
LENTKAISEERDDAKMIYNPNSDADNLREVMQERIKADLMAKTTTSGPHRDDFQIAVSEKAASGFASQGQQRTFALAAKLALADMIRETGNNVIVILDDVFSELDCSRQNQVLKLLKENNQIIITTTSVGNLSEEVLQRSKIITIHKEEEDEREHNKLR